MEAEYLALANATQEGLYLKQLIEEVLSCMIELSIYVDNQSCIAYSINGKGPGRAKHINVKYHFVKELVDSNTLKLEYLPSEENAADIMTKALLRVKHTKAVEMLGMIT